MKSLYEITIEGFRGFNPQRSFRFSNKLTVFYGPGGSGKTSVLQAIQWSIFDSLPQLQISEAKLEDPVVNKHHPRGIAYVRLTFDDGYAITRTTRRLSRRADPTSTGGRRMTNGKLYRSTTLRAPPVIRRGWSITIGGRS